MRGILLSITAALLSVSVQSWAATYHVAPPPEGNDANPGTEAQPFATIQKGIDSAVDADTVIVAQGTYVENIHFNGKNIILTSTDPLTTQVVQATIIDGNQAGSVVTFAGTEDQTCILSGFTIRGGSALEGGGIYGGGADGRTHATIQNNRIAHNLAKWGGSLAYCDGAIRGNTITGNSAEGSHPFGGGGGLAGCDGTIQNNVIIGNSARYWGSALGECNATIQNNTICNNSGSGAPLAYCQGTIRNCILWANTNTGGHEILTSCVLPTYCCIQGWYKGGKGNINYYPYFVDAFLADYHLKSYSPCIDAGDPTSPFSEEPEPNGALINMGAYGNTPEATPKSADTDGDGLPDDWEIEFFASLRQGSDGDPDVNGISNIEEYLAGTSPVGVTLYVDGSVADSGDGTSWDRAFETIQEGINAASGGDTVIVAPGTYTKIGIEKNILLRSTDPSNRDVVEKTIIDGGVIFSGDEDRTCVLSGFTIRNGIGGIVGSTPDHLYTRATIVNNIITGNQAIEGGGLWRCAGITQNNIITGNLAQYGGGLYGCGGVIRNNIIVGNSSLWSGAGGLYGCSGTIQGNTIANNFGRGARGGGGLNYCTGAILNNIIIGNFSESDGGGIDSCNTTIRGNLISGNSAEGQGGGLYGCTGTVENNTIVHNTADSGGALSTCRGTIRNSIIWANSSPQISDSSTPAFSCIEGWTGGGEGNITDFPMFLGWPRETGQWTDAPTFDETTWQTTLVNGEASWPVNDLKGLPINPSISQPLQFVIASNTETTISVWGDVTDFVQVGHTYDVFDYHLDPESPCVDAGDNTIDAERFDLDGNYRRIATKGNLGWSGKVDYIEMEESGAITLIWKGFIDMGAYECQVPGPVPETFAVHSRESMEWGDWTEVYVGKVSQWTDQQASGRQKFYRIEMK